MAQSFTCDGCGTSIDQPKRIGHVVRRDYCADCAVRARAFIDAEEDLRKRCVDQFKSDLDLLVASAREGGFKLPDVSDAG